MVWYLVMVVVLLGALLAHAQYRLVTVQTDITMLTDLQNIIASATYS